MTRLLLRHTAEEKELQIRGGSSLPPSQSTSWIFTASSHNIKWLFETSQKYLTQDRGTWNTICQLNLLVDGLAPTFRALGAQRTRKVDLKGIKSHLGQSPVMALTMNRVNCLF